MFVDCDCIVRVPPQKLCPSYSQLQAGIEDRPGQYADTARHRSAANPGAHYMSQYAVTTLTAEADSVCSVYLPPLSLFCVPASTEFGLCTCLY